jgi:hypothetical protein
MAQTGGALFKYRQTASETEKSISRSERSRREAERYWIVSRSLSKDDARRVLYTSSCKYGLPVVELTPGWQGLKKNELVKVFELLDTHAGIRQLKKDSNLLRQIPPHLTVRVLDTAAQSRSVLVTMDVCPLTNTTTVCTHRMKSLQQGTMFIAPQKESERKFPLTSLAIKFIKNNFSGEFVDFKVSVQLRRRSYIVVPAGWLKAGMIVPVLRNGKLHQATISQTETDIHNSPLHGVSCPDQMTLIANNFILPESELDWWNFTGKGVR